MSKMNKEEIINLILSDKKDDAIKILQDKNNKNTYSEEELKLSLLENEECFKYYNHSRIKNHYYFVSNIGRVLLINIETENNIEEMEIKEFSENRCWIIPQNKETLCLDIDLFNQKSNNRFSEYILNSSTPVYTMVGEAWLAEEYKNMNTKYPNERIELHHINGNSIDCNVNNLIYLPNSIHSRVHIKS